MSSRWSSSSWQACTRPKRKVRRMSSTIAAVVQALSDMPSNSSALLKRSRGSAAFEAEGEGYCLSEFNHIALGRRVFEG